MKTLYSSAVCFLLVFQLTAQSKYYVKTNGFANSNGKSWALAMNNIQKAIDTASPGDFVYVAVGTYKGSFFMKDGVTVLGGYTANSKNPEEHIDIMLATDPSQQSILDGEGSQRVITQYTPFTHPTTWDGFVIQNGKPSGEIMVGSVVFAKNENTIVGIIYKYDAKSNSGMMIGTKEVQKQWGGYLSEIPELPINSNKDEAKADLSGQDNVGMILNELEDSSIDFMNNYTLNGNYAAFWCDTLNIGGYSDWYLPSAGEMHEIYNSNINGILKGISKELQSGYWSSTQVENTLAWTYYFEYGHLRPVLKYVNQKARAIHPYNNTQPSDISLAGGGVFLSKNGILKNCIVIKNQSPTMGGGIYAGLGSSLIDCMVERNSASIENEIYYEKGLSISTVESDKNRLRIYPNRIKAGGNIEIITNQDDILNVRIWSITGGFISSENISGTTITAPEHPGIYFVQINDTTSKLVVY